MALSSVGEFEHGGALKRCGANSTEAGKKVELIYELKTRER